MNEKYNKKKVVIAGRNYCNMLTMIRDFGMGGFQVEALRIYKKKPGILNPAGKMEPEKYSSYLTKYDRIIADENGDEVIKKLITFGDEKEKPLLAGVDDYSVAIIDSHLNQLKKYFVLSSVDGEENRICSFMDKQRMKEEAAKYDLPLLKSFLVKSVHQEFSIPEGIVYPCFVKPNVSKNSGKVKMKKCETKESLYSLFLDYAKSGDFEMLVEEYADIEDEFSILGFSTENNYFDSAVFRVTHGGHKERKGVAITGEIVSADDFSEVRKRCREFIKGINYTGMFDIDLIKTRDGKLYFLELNFRAGASMHLFTSAYLNIPAAYGDSTGTMQSIPTIDTNKYAGKSFISEKVLMEEYIRSDIDKSEAIRLYNQADVRFISDSQDNNPFSNFIKYRKIAYLMRIYHKLKDRG